MLLLHLGYLVDEFASAWSHLDLVSIAFTLLLNRHALADGFSCRSAERAITYCTTANHFDLYVPGVLLEDT